MREPLESDFDLFNLAAFMADWAVGFSFSSPNESIVVLPMSKGSDRIQFK